MASGERSPPSTVVAGMASAMRLPTAPLPKPANAWPLGPLMHMSEGGDATDHQLATDENSPEIPALLPSSSPSGVALSSTQSNCPD